jgi:hypothetical protein
MPPVSYNSLKIVHEQMIQEALERRRFPAGPEKPQHRLLQTFGTFLARLTNRSAQKPPATFPDGHRELESKFPETQRRCLSRPPDVQRVRLNVIDTAG